MMRTESELTMRNMRNLNQELQAQVKEVCTLHIWNHSPCRRAELLLLVDTEILVNISAWGKRARCGSLFTGLKGETLCMKVN